MGSITRESRATQATRARKHNGTRKMKSWWPADAAQSKSRGTRQTRASINASASPWTEDNCSDSGHSSSRESVQISAPPAYTRMHRGHTLTKTQTVHKRVHAHTGCVDRGEEKGAPERVLVDKNGVLCDGEESGSHDTGKQRGYSKRRQDLASAVPAPVDRVGSKGRDADAHDRTNNGVRCRHGHAESVVSGGVAGGTSECEVFGVSQNMVKHRTRVQATVVVGAALAQSHMHAQRRAAVEGTAHRRGAPDIHSRASNSVAGAAFTIYAQQQAGAAAT